MSAIGAIASIVALGFTVYLVRKLGSLRRILADEPIVEKALEGISESIGHIVEHLGDFDNQRNEIIYELTLCRARLLTIHRILKIDETELRGEFQQFRSFIASKLGKKFWQRAVHKIGLKRKRYNLSYDDAWEAYTELNALHAQLDGYLRVTKSRRNVGT